MTARLRWLDAPAAADVPPHADAFLRRLAGPTALRIPGRDRSRTRVVVTLSHGNEPSGFRAVHGFLRSGTQPVTDALLLLTSVEAALLEPLYSHRQLSGRRDLNRCFRGPFDDPEGALAREVLAAIDTAKPEAVVDLHNNSGHNPPYALGPVAGPRELVISTFFGERFVVTQLEIGALVEVAPSPVITVECGRGGDPRADEVATRGLARFLATDPLVSASGSVSARPSQLLLDPVRVCLRTELSLAVADAPRPGAHFTLRADVDRHNFETLPAGTCLGWLAEGCGWPLEARGADGADRSHQLFALRGDALETRSTLVPIMMTTDPQQARSDCLFYAVRRAPEPAAGRAD